MRAAMAEGDDSDNSSNPEVSPKRFLHSPSTLDCHIRSQGGESQGGAISADEAAARAVFDTGGKVWDRLMCYIHQKKQGMNQVVSCRVETFVRALVTKSGFKYSSTSRATLSSDTLIPIPGVNGCIPTTMSIICKIEEGELCRSL